MDSNNKNKNSCMLPRFVPEQRAPLPSTRVHFLFHADIVIPCVIVPAIEYTRPLYLLC